MLLMTNSHHRWKIESYHPGPGVPHTIKSTSKVIKEAPRRESTTRQSNLESRSWLKDDLQESMQTGAGCSHQQVTCRWGGKY
jgi:hypothetical protein